MQSATLNQRRVGRRAVVIAASDERVGKRCHVIITSRPLGLGAAFRDLLSSFGTFVGEVVGEEEKAFGPTGRNHGAEKPSLPG